MVILINLFQNAVQGVFYDIANSSKFELCIVIVIFLNMIQMAVDHYGQTQMVTDILDMLNILFVVIFTLEAIVKIVGLRWHYFTQPWNIFDFIVVIISLLGKDGFLSKSQFEDWTLYFLVTFKNAYSHSASIHLKQG